MPGDEITAEEAIDTIGDAIDDLKSQLRENPKTPDEAIEHLAKANLELQQASLKLAFVTLSESMDLSIEGDADEEDG
jgi:hypothetical protein